MAPSSRLVLTSECLDSRPTEPVTRVGSAARDGAGRLTWTVVASRAPGPGATVPGAGPPEAGAALTENVRAELAVSPNVKWAVAVAV